MNTHTVTLTLTVSADTPAVALNFGRDAGVHLRESFNDDDSIVEGILVNVDALSVPRTVLAEFLAVLLMCEVPRRMKDRAINVVGMLRALPDPAREGVCTDGSCPEEDGDGNPVRQRNNYTPEHRAPAVPPSGNIWTAGR